MRRLGFDTWLERTPKDKVFLFLRDRGFLVRGLHEGVTKDRIRYQLDSYGLRKKVEEEINRIRTLQWRFKVDMLKYGSWVGGGR